MNGDYVGLASDSVEVAFVPVAVVPWFVRREKATERRMLLTKE